VGPALLSAFMSSGVLHLGVELPGLPSLCVCLPSPTWAAYVATGLPFYRIRLPSFPWGRVCRPSAACSPPFINVGFHTSALGCLHRCEQPYLGVHLPSSAWVRTSALGCRRRCGLLYFGVGSSSLDVGRISSFGRSSLLLGPRRHCWAIHFSLFGPASSCRVVMSLPRRLSRSLLARLDTLAFGKRGVSGVEYKGTQKASHDFRRGSFS